MAYSGDREIFIYLLVYLFIYECMYLFICLISYLFKLLVCKSDSRKIEM